MTFLDHLKSLQGKLVFIFTLDSYMFEDGEGKFTSAIGGRLIKVHDDFIEIANAQGFIRALPAHNITTIQEMRIGEAVREGFETDALNKMAKQPQQPTGE